MAEYGKFYKRLWRLKRFAEMKDLSKLLYCYIVSCDHSNSLGLYHVREEYIIADLRWSVAKLKSAMKELIEKNWIQHDEENDIILVNDWFDGTTPAHSIQNKNQLKKVLADLSEIYRSHLVGELIKQIENGTSGIPDRYLKPLLKRLGERLPKPLGKPLSHEAETEEETEGKAEEETELGKLRELYNRTCPDLPQASKVSGWPLKRRQAALARLKEHPISDEVFWVKLFQYVQGSDWLCGRSKQQEGQPWRCNLHWIMTKEKFAKVVGREYSSGETGERVSDLVPQ